MANTIERVLGWIAALALLLALGALAITFLPGGQDWWTRVTATFTSRTDKPTIEDAQSALDGGDSASADTIASAVVAADPSDASVDNQAGNIAERANDQQAAEHDYQAGEAADDKNPWNFVALGELYAREEKYSQADTQLRAALSIVPDAQFLHYDLGVVELHEQLTDSALADFEAELKRSPGYQPALEGKAEALGLLGRPYEAGLARKLALTKPSPSPSPSVQPSPTGSPSPAASPSPNASPMPSPRPSPVPSPVVALAPSPHPHVKRSPAPTGAPTAQPMTIAALPIAKVVIPSAHPTSAPTPAPSAATVAASSSAPHATPAARKTQVARPVAKAPVRRTVAALPAATPALPSPTPTRGRLPLSITDLATEAKGYLFEVAGDPNFTRQLPFADPTESVAEMESTIQKGSVEDILSAGTAAMLTHHFALAQSAFAVASDDARRDWRGPYLAGINAQQRGDQAAARTFFTQAASRGGPAAVYVSLAVADVAEGDDNEALDNARRAQQLAPDFAPATFTAGMIDILLADVPSAENELALANASNGAPDRTSYFLTTLRQREESSP